MQTVGAFLKEKLGNMARWVTEEVGKENLSVDLEQFVRDRSEVEVTFLSQVLNSNSAKISHRDWCGLVGMLHDDAIPKELAEQFAVIIQVVRVRETMHDKFWRYLELFRDVVNSDAHVE